MYFVRDVSIIDWQTLGYHDFNVPTSIFFFANDLKLGFYVGRCIDYRYTLFKYLILIRHIDIRRK